MPGDFGKLICAVSESQYNHCGMVVKDEDGLWVIEAIGPVIYSDAAEWIATGIGHKFTQVRVKNATENEIIKVVESAEEFLDLPYDMYMKMDDSEIYCSELIYKAWKKGAGIEVGETVLLGDMNWKPYEKYIRKILENGDIKKGAPIPIDRVIITPEALIKNDLIEILHDDFKTE